MSPILNVENLSVAFRVGDVQIAAVRQVSLDVAAGECVAVVGESGCGKTQLCLAIMGLLPANARVDGSVRFGGRDLLAAPRAQWNAVRGAQLAMIFQDPQSSLTPHLRIGTQMAEVLVEHRKLGWRDAEAAALAMLRRVRVPDAARRMRQYPHELSGGMRQRVMIGMSLLCEPDVVLADEPTTALDATIQAQVIATLREMRRTLRTSIVLVSHDLSVVAGLADRVYVMYAGRIVESASAADLFAHPRHPYTAALMNCVPRLSGPVPPRLETLPGQPPNPAQRIDGCAFAPRCAFATERCAREAPPLRPLEGSTVAACHLPLPR